MNYSLIFRLIPFFLPPVKFAVKSLLPGAEMYAYFKNGDQDNPLQTIFIMRTGRFTLKERSII
ncbi:MAG: hypothetical protein D3903_00970 [Candidatus Electrothrix sp. GM3_4]|nr:hypothetical protein [Candidatus Electrothrix sp. GM3_4]